MKGLKGSGLNSTGSSFLKALESASLRFANCLAQQSNPTSPTTLSQVTVMATSPLQQVTVAAQYEGTLSFLPLDWYSFQFPGVRLLPDDFGLLGGRLSLNAMAVLTTMKYSKGLMLISDEIAVLLSNTPAVTRQRWCFEGWGGAGDWAPGGVAVACGYTGTERQ